MRDASCGLRWDALVTVEVAMRCGVCHRAVPSPVSLWGTSLYPQIISSVHCCDPPSGFLAVLRHHEDLISSLGEIDAVLCWLPESTQDRPSWYDQNLDGEPVLVESRYDQFIMPNWPMLSSDSLITLGMYTQGTADVRTWLMET